MKVASIVPIPYLHLVDGKPYQMCLAHLAYQDSEYAEFYRRQREKGCFVLLDNGAAEKSQLSLDQLLQVVEMVNPNELILPDEIYNTRTTLDRSYRAIHRIKQLGMDVQLMAVPQGETFQDWIDCATSMAEWPIQTIGVSKFMSYKLGQCARFGLLGAIVGYLLRRGIRAHMLGCAYDPRETAAMQLDLLLCKAIRGTDSSMPYVYAHQKLNMYEAVRQDVPRSQEEVDFYDNSTSVPLIAANIQIWEDMADGKLL